MRGQEEELGEGGAGPEEEAGTDPGWAFMARRRREEEEGPVGGGLGVHPRSPESPCSQRGRAESSVYQHCAESVWVEKGLRGDRREAARDLWSAGGVRGQRVRAAVGGVGGTCFPEPPSIGWRCRGEGAADRGFLEDGKDTSRFDAKRQRQEAGAGWDAGHTGQVSASPLEPLWDKAEVTSCLPLAPEL